MFLQKMVTLHCVLFVRANIFYSDGWIDVAFSWIYFIIAPSISFFIICKSILIESQVVVFSKSLSNIFFGFSIILDLIYITYYKCRKILDTVRTSKNRVV